MTADPCLLTPVLLDFGLAKRDMADATVTAEGQILGTPAYMSPEQARGASHAVDRRSDVYSLGVVLYELLAGVLPFRGNARMLLHQVLHDEPPPPRRLDDRVPRDLETICLKALAKEPERRYASARDLADDLRAWLGGRPIAARPVGYVEKTWRWCRRNPLVAGLAAVLSFVIVGSLIGLTVLYWDAESARIRAERAEEEERSAAGAARVAQEQSKQDAIKARHAESIAKSEASKARQAEKEARHAANATAALNKFLLDDVLAAPRPEGVGLGREVTLRAALDKAAGKIGTAFALAPEAEAAVRHTLGVTYTALGDLKAAQAQLQQALDQRREHLGADHLDTLHSTLALAQVTRQLDRPGDAEKLVRQTLAQQQQTRRLDRVTELTAQNLLAGALKEQNKGDEARELFIKTLAEAERELGAEHELTLALRNNLGVLYQGQKRYADAEPLLRAAWTGRRQVLGREHPETIGSQSNLANNLRALNQLEEAETLLTDALALREKVLGADHPQTLITRNNLAGLFERQKRFADAEPLHRAVLEGRRRVLPAGHVQTLTSMRNLANCLAQIKKYREAEPLLREFVDTLRKLPPSARTAEDVQDGLDRLARLLKADQRPAEAVTAYRERAAHCRELLGPTHIETLVRQSDLALMLQQYNQHEEAISLFEATLKAQRATLGARHTHVAITRENLALAYMEKERFAEAETLLREDLADLEQRGPVTSRLYLVKGHLADCLIGEKKFAEAEPFALAAHEGIARSPGAPPPIVAAALQRVIQLYTLWGKEAEAEKWRKRSR